MSAPDWVDEVTVPDCVGPLCLASVVAWCRYASALSATMSSGLAVAGPSSTILPAVAPVLSGLLVASAGLATAGGTSSLSVVVEVRCLSECYASDYVACCNDRSLVCGAWGGVGMGGAWFVASLDGWMR